MALLYRYACVHGHGDRHADALGFVGDGRYPNDGGRALQRLWDHRHIEWREIRGCPGRYTTTRAGGDVLRHTSAARLLDELSTPFSSTSFEPQNKDPCSISRFHNGGGGLVTYIKACTKGLTSRQVFVHTLNTESGLIRKVSRSAVRGHDMRRRVCYE